ncbi:DUF2306 domain-containing protein [Algoriphagus jejuensis]|uniref:DUF2306 domain-containing protein n=1 Tax=Algoriphagus jejuensis TaxID=419934 RepID=UPI0031DF5992
MNAIVKKAGWWIFAMFGIAIGLYPAIYFMIDRRFGLLGSKSEVLLADPVWNATFYTHILLGGFALLIGWIQFDKGFRDRRRKLHKRIGMAYVTAVFFSSLAGIYIGFFATGGLVSILGFVSLGIIWFCTTMMGWVTAKKQDYEAHEDWMIFSYAAAFAAVTLRIWLPILIALHRGEFLPAYHIVAWLCWVPNMLVAFWLVRRRRRSISQPNRNI